LKEIDCSPAELLRYFVEARANQEMPGRKPMDASSSFTFSGSPISRQFIANPEKCNGSTLLHRPGLTTWKSRAAGVYWKERQAGWWVLYV